jgi:hypothetical protein
MSFSLPPSESTLGQSLIRLLVGGLLVTGLLAICLLVNCGQLVER